MHRLPVLPSSKELLQPTLGAAFAKVLRGRNWSSLLEPLYGQLRAGKVCSRGRFGCDETMLQESLQTCASFRKARPRTGGKSATACLRLPSKKALCT